MVPNTKIKRSLRDQREENCLNEIFCKNHSFGVLVIAIRESNFKYESEIIGEKGSPLTLYHKSFELTSMQT